MCGAQRDWTDDERAADGALEGFRRAEALLAQRRPLEALRELEPALHVQPETPSVLLLAGRAYFRSAQLRRAELTFTRLVELDPTDHYARFILGRTLQRRGKLTEASAQLKMAFAMHPVPEYQDALAEVVARRKLTEP